MIRPRIKGLMVLFLHLDPELTVVRNRAKELAELLSDSEKIRTERRKAKQSKTKYTGVGSDEAGFGGSGKKYGGFGSEDLSYGSYSGQVYGMFSS
jgi:epsin